MRVQASKGEKVDFTRIILVCLVVCDNSEQNVAWRSIFTRQRVCRERRETMPKGPMRVLKRCMSFCLHYLVSHAIKRQPSTLELCTICSVLSYWGKCNKLFGTHVYRTWCVVFLYSAVTERCGDSGYLFFSCGKRTVFRLLSGVYTCSFTATLIYCGGHDCNVVYLFAEKNIIWGI